jgi:hypothetical protein
MLVEASKLHILLENRAAGLEFLSSLQWLGSCRLLVQQTATEQLFRNQTNKV